VRGARRADGKRSGPALVTPAAVRMVDLDAPLPDLSLHQSPQASPYKSLLLVARLGGQPLGAATVAPLPEKGISARAVADAVRAQLGSELREHLARHGVELPDSLPAGGLRLSTAGDVASTTSGPWVTVVVTTCRNPGPLRRCLESVLESDYRRFDVIIVENRPGSLATSQLLAERFAAEDRIQLVEETRQGAAWARNAGLAHARGEIIAFADDDVVIDPGWIRNLADAFARREDLACVTGLVLPLSLETPTQLLFEQLLTPGKGFHRRTFHVSDQRQADPLFPYTPGEMGSAANMALRADIAHRLRGFDTSIGRRAGLEIELFIRILLRGYAIAYEPSAIVWHEHPTEMGRLRRRAFRYGVGLTAMLTKKVVAGPERMDLIRRVPAGCRHVLDPTSRKNAQKPTDYPRSLDGLERVGMLLGPGAYFGGAAASAWRRRRHPGADRGR
jgi:O-antigen biosynthesis protein